MRLMTGAARISPIRASAATLRSREGFTLAEVAVVILIVGFTLVGLLQGLSKSRLSMAHTKNLKIANQLALLTIGQIESGLFIDEDLDMLYDTYAEEGYPDWAFDVLVGDDTFSEQSPSSDDGFFDSFAYREDMREEEAEEQDREEEDLPFEKVRVRVTFPGYLELKNTIIIERWIPWEQVYGPQEEEAGAAQTPLVQ